MQIDSKIPFYNLINILFTGLVFLGACLLLYWSKIQEYIAAAFNDYGVGFEVFITLALIAIAYEVGYVIFRVGGTLLEPIIKKWDKRLPYTDFVAAEKEYGKLTELSREYGFASK